MRKRNPRISKNSNTCDDNTETTKRMDLKKLSVALLSTLVIMTSTFGLVSPASAGELALTPDAATPQGVSDPCPAGPDSFGYVCAPAARLPLPASTDIGNHCLSCVTQNVPIGFSFAFYDRTFTTVSVSSSGNVQFVSANIAFGNTALPFQGFNYAIVPYWDDLRTDFCGFQGFPGVFRATLGAAPFRVFVLEWHACYPAPFFNAPVTFQLQLEESTSDIYFVYGAINVPPPTDPSHLNGGSATSGIQQGTGQAFLQHTFNQPVLTPGSAVVFTRRTLTPCEVIINDITNGGWIIATNGDRASFGGNAHVDSIGNVNGQEEYQDHGPAQGMTLHGNVLVVVCSRDFTHATIFGRADVAGFGSGTHVYRIDVADLSQSGTNDRYGISVDNGYDSGDQQLMGGNVQIHPSA